MFYSKSTGGFYDESIHGSRVLSIIDPVFVWPQIEIENREFDPDTSVDGPTIFIDDPDVIPPIIEIDNPDCNIPADAVKIPDEEYVALLEAQSSGKIIQADKKGYPVAVDPPPPSAANLIKQQIATLESTVTERRIREAILGTDNGWLATVNAQIVALRKGLK